MSKEIVPALRDTMASSSGQIQPLKIPDAVVALAQAAAKANGEAEKYLPGWPLFSPPKLQLQKCSKCSREFCSSFNLKRHNRVHRRTLKIEKDFVKNRDHIAAFWDRLMMDQAKTVLSVVDVVIEGVSGLSILTALSTWMCKPGYASLPLAYARAGNELLDLIQTTASRLPISSKELFSMLDEASENTFLCINTAACTQKFLFGGEADKVATELKNVVACTSYMLEQKLVEAWSADKAAEALRFQKLLVEEEEAAQRRQAELMERKRMKKLRQKEQRLKDLKDEDVMACLSGIVDGTTNSDPGSYEQEDPQLPTPIALEEDSSFNVDLPVEFSEHNSVHELNSGVILRQQVIARHHLVRPENLAQNSFASGSAIPSKHPVSSRHTHYRGPNANTVSNRNKTWAWKVRTEIEERLPKEEVCIDDEQEMFLNKNSRVLIGSISVAIEDGRECLQDIQYSSQPIIDEEKINEYIDPIVVNITPTIENSSFSNVELADSEGLRSTMLSSKEAAAFLSQRWKQAIAADHVKLVICPET